MSGPGPAVPRGSGGRHFVVYGDCCSGIPGSAHARNFHAINAALRRLAPRPDFVCFLGDHIVGLTADVAELRRQWHHVLDVELKELRAEIPDFYHLTSNHNTFSAESVDVWRECFPSLPQNGPAGEQGLTYWVRRGDLLLVILNTASVARGGAAGIAEDVSLRWLPDVLQANRDAARKFVLGHHPIHPVNGYRESPKWCLPPDEGEQLWEVLASHAVDAYVCSHIIAFDVQVHRGVLQVTSGGAGTVYGPGGAMPCPPEYLHFVDIAADACGVRLRTRDAAGQVREWLAWPPNETVRTDGRGADPDATVELAQPELWQSDQRRAHLLSWCFSAANGRATRAPAPFTLLHAHSADARHAIELGADEVGRIILRRHETVGDARATAEWRGPVISPTAIDLEIGIHTGMGPGGMLWRPVEPGGPWTSMTTSTATGLEGFPWCGRWRIGPHARLAQWRIVTESIDQISGRPV